MWGQVFSLENGFCDKYCTSDYMIWDQPCESTEGSKNENFQGISTKSLPRLELGQKEFVMRDTSKDTVELEILLLGITQQIRELSPVLNSSFTWT